MTRYVVETYVPATGRATFQVAAGELRRTGDEAGAGVSRPRWIDSYVVPEDEIGFVVLEARTLDDVIQAVDAVGLEADRIVIAIDIEAGLGAGA